MKIFNFFKRASAIEYSSDGGHSLFWGGSQSTSGVTVTPDTALRVPVVASCVRLISQTIASLPLQLYKKEESGRRVLDKTNLYEILHDNPNQELTTYRWRSLFMRHLLLQGRHFSRIERNAAGQVLGIYPLLPENVSIMRVDGKLKYQIQLATGGTETLPSDEILHFTWFESNNGLDGVSPIDMAKDAIGLAIALEQYGAAYFKNGGSTSMVLEVPTALSDEAHARLKSSLQSNHVGVANSHKVMVLEQGTKISTSGADPQKSQFLESRKMQRQEIANIFNVPMFFLGDSDPAKANSEQQALFFVKYTISPWLEMIEQELNSKLLTKKQRKTQYIEFNVDGLLRGDFKTRMEGYASSVQNAIMTPNEVRARENLPSIVGGDELVIQQNMSALGALPMQKTPTEV